MKIPCAVTILENAKEELKNIDDKAIVTFCIQELQRNGFIKINENELAINPLPKITQEDKQLHPPIKQ